MPATTTALDGRETISDGNVVAEILRQGILAGDYAPGQRLVEADLIEDINASRAAVRASLATLAVEGLVEKIRHRGVRVRSLDLDEALEITEIRAALESMCVAKATVRISDSEKDELRAIGADMKTAVGEGDIERYSKLNGELHRAILEASGTKIAPEIVNRLKAQQARFSIRLARQANRPAKSLPEHLKIIEAVCSGDPDHAKKRMEEHLLSVREATQEFFASRR